MLKRLTLFLGFAAALMMAGNVAQAAQADVTGEWLLTLSLPNGNERVITLNLEQEGGEITGTALREGQEEPSEVTGTIDGNDIVLNIMGGGRGGRGGGGRGGPRPWEGTVDGDTMSGVLSMGGRGEIQWTAERQ